MTRANTRKRIHAISIEGNVADRYFAVTSETPRNTVEARISAIPRNGRSARAGAVRVADFFSGNGNSALSSLAAAAGGGVPAETRAPNFATGVPPKNNKYVGMTRYHNKDPTFALGVREISLTPP